MLRWLLFYEPDSTGIYSYSHTPARHYSLSIFGKSSAEAPGGLRIEAYHLSVNCTSTANRLVSATPEFMGANPAIVPSRPEKGLQVLKDESELGFQLLHSLSDAQLQKTLIRAEAPSEIGRAHV